MSRPGFICAVVVSLLWCATLRADDWPGYRGPNRDGKSAETGLLQAWAQGGPPMLATIEGCGRGYSGLCVAGGNLYVSGITDGQEFVRCFDSVGKQRWATAICGGEAIKAGDLPRSTPTIAGGNLYVRAIDGSVLALNCADGQKIWSVDVVGKFHGTLPPGVPKNDPWETRFVRDSLRGMTESVLVDGGHVIVCAGGPDAAVVALDAKTGDTVWTSKGVGDACSGALATAFDFGNVHQIAALTDKGLIGLRADSGGSLWNYDCATRATLGTKFGTPPDIALACPLYSDGLVFIGQCGAARLKQEGGKFTAEKAFDLPAKNTTGYGFPIWNMWHNGSVLIDGHLFGAGYSTHFYTGAAHACCELTSGAVNWQEVNPRTTGPLLYADGRLYCQSEFGCVRLLQPSTKQYTEMGKLYFPYMNGHTVAQPAISDGKLFVRNMESVFVYDISADDKPSPATQPIAQAPAQWALPEIPKSEDWPQFRGPNRDSISGETGLLRKWPKQGPPLIATLKIGAGQGSAAIVGDRFYIPGTIGKDCFLYCFDLETQQKIWQSRISAAADAAFAAGPDATPTVDGDVVFQFARDGMMWAFNRHSGDPIWSVNIAAKFHGSAVSYGWVESPLIDGDHLITMAGGPDATIVALDKKTGETVWATKGLSDRAAAGSPLIFDYQGHRLICAETQLALVCVDAKDGRFYRRYDRPVTTQTGLPSGFGPIDDGANLTTPVYRDGIVFAANYHRSGGGAVKLGVDGDRVTGTQLWDSNDITCKTSGFLVLGDYIFGGGSDHATDERWAISCLELHTGQRAWMNYDGSMDGPIMYADGMLYVTGMYSTHVSLVQATPTGFHMVSSFDQKEHSYSYPSLAHGRLFLRANSKLLIYDVRENPPTTQPATQP